MAKNLLTLLFAVLLVDYSMATEKPKYTVIEQSGAFELRSYGSMIIAETKISGALSEASSRGFRVLADYIFGNNTSHDGGSEKVSMTSPVAMRPEPESINMTAPVNMSKTQGQWHMYFVMPKEYTLNTLPEPNNPAVILREMPARKYAVIRFSGLVRENKVAEKLTELMSWLDSKNMSPIGEPEIARYNPPWTLPAFRRNEIMVEY